MKRTAFSFVSLFLSVLLLSLSSCTRVAGKNLKPEDILFVFQCQATVTGGGAQTECEISRSAPGVISVKITSGDLNGMVFFWKDNGFSVSYSGLTAENEDCVLPKTSFAYLIQQTLDSASSLGDLTVSHGDEFSGSAVGYDYTLEVDAQTGRIRKINIPKYSVTVDLHHYSQLGV